MRTLFGAVMTFALSNWTVTAFQESLEAMVPSKSTHLARALGLGRSPSNRVILETGESRSSVPLAMFSRDFGPPQTRKNRVLDTFSIKNIDFGVSKMSLPEIESLPEIPDSGPDARNFWATDFILQYVRPYSHDKKFYIV